jgi:hypothetical protein
MMSAYAQFTTAGDPIRRSHRAAQNIHFETRPPATTKRATLEATDTGFKGLLNNAVDKAREAYTEDFMTLDDVKRHPLYLVAVAGLVGGPTVNDVGQGVVVLGQTVHADTPAYKGAVVRRAFSRHNAHVASRFDGDQATAPRFGESFMAVPDAATLRQDAANVDIAFGYKDRTGYAANPLTGLRTYDVADPHAAAHPCSLAYPGIAEHMALCLYRASDIDMNGNGREGISRVLARDATAEDDNLTIDSSRPLIALNSGPLGDAGAVPYSHSHGQMTLRQWQDWTILQIAHMERVEMLDERSTAFSINMVNRAVQPLTPLDALDTGGMWCQATNHTRRNVLMALLYSRTDDELHAQTLFGYDWRAGIAPTCHQVEAAVRYDSRCDIAVVGTEDVYTYADNGIVRANVPGEAIFMTSEGVGATAIEQEIANAEMATFDKRAGKTLFVVGKEVTLPLLEFDGKYVVDLRPDTVVPGLYMKGHDELLGNELLEQVPTVQLYEAPDIRAAVRELTNNNVLRYRHAGDEEPDWKDATLLRTQNSVDMIDDTVPANNAAPSTGNLVMTGQCVGVHGSTTVGTDLFRREFPLQFPAYPTDFHGHTFPLSGDGTPGSIDRIVARYSYHVRADFARRSFTGMTLPITILPGALGPAPALAVGTDVDNRIYFTKCATAGYGEYGLPGPSIRGFEGGCRAVVAKLAKGSFIATDQIIRNPRQLVPTAVDLASAMSRRGRHNEVGIAMQSLQADRQGDIMLHDGV